MTSQEIALRDAVNGAVAQLRDHEFEQQVALALPDPTLARRFLRVAATAALEKPELATADRASLIRALLKCAADNLLPDGRQAALVVRNNRQKGIEEVTYQPMILGVRSTLAEFGWALMTAVIYANDHFEDHSDQGYVEHRRAKLGEERGEPVGAWAMAKHSRFGSMALVYDENQIQEVRKKYSKTDKVWNDRPDQMREKTVGHRLAKMLPLDPKDRERLDKIIAATDLDTGEKIDLMYGGSPAPAATDRAGDRAPDPDGSVPQASAAPDDEGPTTAGPSDFNVIDVDAEEIPFEGEEPPPVTDEPVEAATFSTGRYAKKTLDEVLASGKDGLSYLRWAFNSWKSEPLRSALDRFAEAHPEIKP